MTKCSTAVWLALGFTALSAGPAAAQLTSTRIATGFNQPLFATSAPGDPGTLYVVERGGTIRTLNTLTGAVGSSPFLNLPANTAANFLAAGGEQGLLGLAFHPNFQQNGRVYVNYTYANGVDAGGATRVEEYQVSGGIANTATARTIIQFDHPIDTNHNAGWIGFNPANGAAGANSGHLYIMTGDGGGGNDPRNNGQSTNTLLGKILRIDVNGASGGNNYAIPAGNLTGAGVRSEIYSYGLRNPFRASFDRATGHLYIGDVGQGSREEINFIANGSPGGQNFGWRLREGTIETPGGVGGPRPPGNVDPIHEYGRDLGASVTGGYVYRGTGTDLGQPLDGTYFFGDFVSGRIWSLRYNGTAVSDFRERTSELRTATNGGTISNISSFAEDGFGNIYVIDYDGEIFRLNPVPEPATVGLVAAGAVAVWAGRRRRTRAG